MYGIIYTVKKTRPHNNERGYLLCSLNQFQALATTLQMLLKLKDMQISKAMRKSHQKSFLLGAKKEATKQKSSQLLNI